MKDYWIGAVEKKDYIDPSAASMPEDSSNKWSKQVMLVVKTQLSHNTWVFTYAFVEDFQMWLEPGQHISLLAPNGVSRPYTPTECRGREFDCVIKIYE